MTDENRKAAAQEFLEIINHRAQHSRANSAQKLREHRRRLAPLADLTSDVHLQAVLAELDRQSANLELGFDAQSPTKV